MPKSFSTYWNVLSPQHQGRWSPVRGLEGMAEELTLAEDRETGHYTGLTRFFARADTTMAWAGKSQLSGGSVYHLGRAL
jgi:hypothetical protein